LFVITYGTRIPAARVQESSAVQRDPFEQILHRVTQRRRARPDHDPLVAERSPGVHGIGSPGI
jgi:hypothetical protein